MTLGLATPTTVWGRWLEDPLAALTLALVAFAYGLGVRALWARSGRGAVIALWQPWAFAAGLALAAVALLSPLEALAHTLFSAHMVQHLLLVLAVAPLLVAGAPMLPLLHALPPGWRRRAQRWRASPAVRRFHHSVLGMLVACAAHLVAMWGWHIPALYQLAVRSPVVHALEHALLAGTAVWVWTTILQRGGPVRRARPTAAVAMFLTGTLTVGLGPLLVLSSTGWYPVYASGAAAWGLTLVEDQQMAGAIMWGIGGLFYPMVGAVLFARWLVGDAREPERLARRSAWWQSS